MLFTSPVIAAASGSLAGLTASRNRYGNYFRARAVPVQPNTTQQQLRKAFFNLVSTSWRNVDPGRRDDWKTYADNTPIINKLGFAITLSANAMYQRCNAARVPTGLGFATVAPVDFGLPEVSPITITAAPSGDIGITFDDTDAWANIDGAGMMVYVSRPVGESINFFKGPFRFVSTILGATALPPTSPATVSAPFALAVGQKVFVRVNVTDSDGRLSTDQIVSAIVA